MRTSGSSDLAQVAKEAKLFTGNESLIEVNNHDVTAGVKVRGLVAKPVHFRGDRKAILTMVNNRPVRCPLTYKALEYAYSDLIPRGKASICRNRHRDRPVACRRQHSSDQEGNQIQSGQRSLFDGAKSHCHRPALIASTEFCCASRTTTTTTSSSSSARTTSI